MEYDGKKMQHKHNEHPPKVKCDLRHEFAKSFSEQKGLILLKRKSFYSLTNSLAKLLVIQ